MPITKVKFTLNLGLSGCNRDSGWLDLREDLCLHPDDWANMSDSEKYKESQEYWFSLGYPDINFEED